MSVLKALLSAWQNRDTLGDKHHDREMAAFLPAALAIQEAPPNPAARFLAWSLLLLLAAALVWACIGQVNIVASAEGKIIPSSRIKQIQPLEKSVVKAILVSEGDKVKKGQALVELDTSLTRADKTRITIEQQNIQARLAVNQQLLNRIKQKQSPSSNNQTLALQQLFDERWQQYQAQSQSLQHQLSKNQAEQAAVKAVVSKLQQTLPIIARRAQKMQGLHQKNFASEEDYLQLKQEHIQQKQDLKAEQQRLKQLQANKQEINEQINLHKAQTSSQLLTEISDMQAQIASLTQELNKANSLNEKQLLLAPVDGTVQELAINTVGGVVTEAQQLMVIVPHEQTLEVEVQLANKDIGFVHEGMAAEIKIHTFPFTKYGLIGGKVNNVSDDAVIDEQRGLLYTMQLTMQKNTLWVDGKNVQLMPGMAVTAEMKTGKRRIIEFFLAPLLRFSDESLRER